MEEHKVEHSWKERVKAFEDETRKELQAYFLTHPVEYSFLSKAVRVSWPTIDSFLNGKPVRRKMLVKIREFLSSPKSDQ